MATTDFTKMIGARVLVQGVLKGELAYYGQWKLHEGNQFYRCGVALDKPKGSHDGTVGGRQLFKCKNEHGCLVQPKKVAIIMDPKEWKKTKALAEKLAKKESKRLKKEGSKKEKTKKGGKAAKGAAGRSVVTWEGPAAGGDEPKQVVADAATPVEKDVAKPAAEPEAKPEPKPKAKPEPKADAKSEIKPEPKVEPKKLSRKASETFTGESPQKKVDPKAIKTVKKGTIVSHIDTFEDMDDEDVPEFRDNVPKKRLSKQAERFVQEDERKQAINQTSAANIELRKEMLETKKKANFKTKRESIATADTNMKTREEIDARQEELAAIAAKSPTETGAVAFLNKKYQAPLQKNSHLDELKAAREQAAREEAVAAQEERRQISAAAEEAERVRIERLRIEQDIATREQEVAKAGHPDEVANKFGLKKTGLHGLPAKQEAHPMLAAIGVENMDDFQIFDDGADADE